MARWRQKDRWIPLWQLPMVVGRSEECDLWLTEPTVSRRHAQLERSGSGLVVRDLQSRFGTFVNGLRVVEKPLQPGDQVRFGRHICYLVREDALERVEAAGAGLVLEEVAIERGGRRLVQAVTAQMQPGQLIGILGPSGVGKTLILRVLAGLFAPAAGQVLWQYTPVQQVLAEYLQQLGYIPQQDLLYETLTVEENVLYAAELRLGQLSASQRAERVRCVLDMVQLSEHRDKKTAVLSGGQRKRLSVAVELLRQPSILLLDEPTTGLDPANEIRLVENLRQIARQGTLVICTTHSLSVVRMFDQVLVLALREKVARQVFYGRPENLLNALGVSEWTDLYKMLEHDPGVPLVGQAEGSPPAKALPGQSPVSGTQEASLKPGDAPRATPSPWTEEELQWPSPDSIPLGRDFLLLQRQAHQGPSAHGLRQCGQVAWRCLTMIRRDWLLAAMMIVQPLLLGLLLVLTQYNPGNVKPIFFFTVVIAIWLGLHNSVRDLVRERRQYIRDRMAGMQVEAYLGAKIGLYLAIGLGQIVLLVLVVRIGTKLVLSSTVEHIYNDLAAVGWLWWIGVEMLVYSCGLGLGLFVSTLVRTEEAAVAALPMLMLPQILLSAMATGDIKTPVSQPRAFLPVVATFSAPSAQNQPGLGHGNQKNLSSDSQEGLSFVQRLVDICSLACYSRPALLVLEPEDMSIQGYSKNIWWGDLCHLLILLAVTYSALWVGLLNQEKYWPDWIGI